METENKSQILSVAQALAYATWDAGKSFDTGDKDGYTMMEAATMEKNHIVEFWHALNRSTPYRKRFIPNSMVDKAIAYTLAWLAFYRAGGHTFPTLGLSVDGGVPVPRWGKEYIVKEK